MIANIALDDALILPHRANPHGIEFSGTTGLKSDIATCPLCATAEIAGYSIEDTLFPLRARRLQLGYDRRPRPRIFFRTDNERTPRRFRALRPPRPRILFHAGGERAQPSRCRRRLASRALRCSGQ